MILMQQCDTHPTSVWPRTRALLQEAHDIKQQATRGLTMILVCKQDVSSGRDFNRCSK